MSLRTLCPRNRVSSSKITEFTVMNSLIKICFYDSLGKGGSLLLFLFAIKKIFLILRKRFGGESLKKQDFITYKWELLQSPSIFKEILTFFFFYHYILKLESSSRYREAASISGKHDWLLSSQDALVTGS